MAEIIKTWPAFMPPEKVRRIFNYHWARFYFSLGRGKPSREITAVWFTHQGRVLGSFPIEAIVNNDGSLPKLKSLDNRESTWQFKFGVWVMVCVPPIHWLHERVYHESFRGWRYFNLAEYSRTVEAKFNLERSSDEGDVE